MELQNFKKATPEIDAIAQEPSTRRGRRHARVTSGQIELDARTASTTLELGVVLY